METKRTIFTNLVALLVFGLVLGLSSCSKKGDPTPVTPPAFKPDKKMLYGAKWSTTTVVYTKTDGTSETKNYSDPAQVPLFLNDAMFYSNGHAVESDYSSDQKYITWDLTDANLVVTFLNPDLTPSGNSVSAKVTALDAHTLTLEMNNYSGFAGTYKKIVQTLTH